MSLSVKLADYDITSYVRSCEIILGMTDAFQHVADVGMCTLIVNNSDRRFSPSNRSSPLYTSLRPNRVVVVQAEGQTIFRGYVRAIKPDAGQYGETQRCTIECCDLLGRLQDSLISLPLQQGQKAGYLLRLITSAALRASRATGSFTLTDVPSDGDTVTIGDVTYTFRTSPSAAFEVKIGADKGPSAENLAAAINAVGTDQITNAYGSGTTKHTQVTAYHEAVGGVAGGTVSIEPASVSTAYVIGIVWVGVYEQAQQFVPETGKLSQIEVYLGASTAGTPGNITWEVRQDAEGLPGDVLQSGEFSPTANAWNTITVSGGVTLYDTQSYWLVLRLTNVPNSGSHYWTWNLGPDSYSDGVKATRADGIWFSSSAEDFFARITTEAISDAAVSLTAVARGAWGNSIALAKSGANITVSGSTLSGGRDEPDGYIDFDTGRMTIDVAADTWSDAETNALSAIRDVVESEFGYFWCARDGTLTFRDQRLLFDLANRGATLVIDNAHNVQDTALTLDDLANRVTVTYTPRGTTVSGVIARAQTVLEVPGRGAVGSTVSNYTRWNPTDPVTQAYGSRTYTIPYLDVGTGRVAGAQSLQLPLVPGTDYTVYDTSDTSGYNYTNTGRVKFSVAVTGSGIEVHMTNTATGTLYVRDLQVRGVALIAFDRVNLVIDDILSQDEYGRRSMTYALPLPMERGAALAEQVARYLLGVYATPLVRVTQIGFAGPEVVNGVSLYTLNIGDVVEITETQTGLSGERHWIIGLQYSLVPDGPANIVLTVAALGSYTYLTLDDDTYGLLDDNRLAL